VKGWANPDGTASLIAEQLASFYTLGFATLSFKSSQVLCGLSFFGHFAVKQRITNCERSTTASAGEQELRPLPNSTQLLIYLRVILIISHHNDIK